MGYSSNLHIEYEFSPTGFDLLFIVYCLFFILVFGIHMIFWGVSKDISQLDEERRGVES